jgi:anaerobic ribonucleoside-triphosphate reductase
MDGPTVVKRDGRRLPWDEGRIRRALELAFRAEAGVPPPRPLPPPLQERVEALTASVAGAICRRARGERSVEEIQDEVERQLMAAGEYRVARRYIIYREVHAAQRNLVGSYLGQADWRIQENSNMGYSLQGLNNYITAAVTQDYWLGRIYPSEIAAAHAAGEIHVHDAGILGPYCVGWDLLDFLRGGVVSLPGRVGSRPPRHFRSALGQLVNLLYTLQGEAAGAQAVSNLDTLLAPFIRADGLGPADVRQALQEFVFNLNVPTRVGFQTPFTNVTLDVRCPAIYRDLPVVIGGEAQEATYGEFQAEMDMFNEAFCDVLGEGDSEGRGFTFPIPTYNVTADFPWDGPVGAAIMRVTAKYGTPYFSNFVNSDLSPDDVRSMCCRLRLDNRELRRRGGGLFGANPLTGSLGVVTLNLPRLAYVSRDEDAFFAGLDRLADLARDSLLIKREAVEGFTDQGLYPYSRVYLQGVHAATGRWWSNHFNTIGVHGANEACLNLLGEDIGTPRGKAFAVAILQRLRSRLRRYQEETGQLFNLEATPAEGVTYRFARLDREAFPGIRQAGDPAGDTYYTNSTHLPVGYTDDPLAVLEHQDALQTLYTGGTVVHLFLGERVQDPRAVGELVSLVTAGFRLPYFTLTPTYSVCPTHGYVDGEHPHCPRCGREAEVWSRVVGYYRPVQSWNRGKRQEFADRLPYRLSLEREVSPR